MNEMPILPVTDILRPVRLRTDVDLPGVHTLSLVGDNAFRVWQSQAPSTNDAPLLVSGQTATNGIDGVSWNTGSTDHVYIEAVANGTATLMYRYAGAGAAAGIVCRASLKMTAWRFGLAADFDRDGKIDEADQANKAVKGAFRFWINDDRDEGIWGTVAKEDAPENAYDGENSDIDLSGRVRNCEDDAVNGVRDMVDFFPLRVDFPDVPTGGGWSFWLRQEDEAVNFVYAPLMPEAVGDWMTNACASGFGVARDRAAETCSVVRVTASGVEICEAWRQGATSVVVFCEGRYATEAPLVLEARQNGQTVGLTKLPLSLSPVQDMFRYLNVRTNDVYFTDDPDRPATAGLWTTRLDQPPNLPDNHLLTNNAVQKTIVMVHGLDWDEKETPAGHSEIFKRLHQAGSNARYVGVSWASDLARRDLSILGLSISELGPVVYANDVIGAFIAAKLVKDALPESLLGVNATVVAHSLGNVLVSSAIQDQGMSVGNYVMLNPAVPTEAYDGRAPASDVDRRNMMHPEWRGAASDGSQDYIGRVMSAGWSTLFSSSDPRYKITWDNRFGGVVASSNVWQFYSSGEEILRPSESDMPPLFNWPWQPGMSLASGREWVWVYHERTKGVLNSLLATQIPRHRAAGWAFNPYWGSKTPAEAALIAETNLVQNPFFKAFNPDAHATVPSWWNPAAWLYLPDGDIEIYNRLPYPQFSDIGMAKLKNRAKLLAEMIPPLSSPAGGKGLTVLTDPTSNRAYDVNEAPYKNVGLWPETRPQKSIVQQEDKRWLHGDYKDAPFRLTYTLYEKIKEISE